MLEDRQIYIILEMVHGVPEINFITVFLSLVLFIFSQIYSQKYILSERIHSRILIQLQNGHFVYKAFSQISLSFSASRQNPQ